MPNIYTGGTFDLLHAGHIEFLETLHVLAGGHKVIVGLNSDEFIERFKGEPPVTPFIERRRMLNSLRCVDRVVPNVGDEDFKRTYALSFSGLRSSEAIGIIAIGSDWHKNDDGYLKQLGIDWEWLYEHHIGLLYIPRRYPQSTTKIKKEVLRRANA